MTALGDFSSGDVLTAADLNAIGTWTTFTPTWTFSGNAITTITFNYGRYLIINDLVVVKCGFRYSSKAGGGTLNLTLPSAASITPIAPFDRLGSGALYNPTTTSTYGIQPLHNNLSTTEFFFLYVAGGNTVTDTSPFTFSANVEVFVTLIGVKA